MPTIEALSLLLGGLGLVLAGSRHAARGFGEALLDGLLRRGPALTPRSTAAGLGVGYGLIAPSSPRSVRAMFGSSASGRFDPAGALALAVGTAIGCVIFAWGIALGAGTSVVQVVAMNVLLAGALCASHGARTRRDGLIGVGLVLLGVEFAHSGAGALAEVATPFDALGLGLAARIAVFVLAGLGVTALAGGGVAVTFVLTCASAGMLSETSAAGALAGVWAGMQFPAVGILTHRIAEEGEVGHRPETRRVAAASLVVGVTGAVVGIVGLVLCLPLMGELPGSFAQPAVFLATLFSLTAFATGVLAVSLAPTLVGAFESIVRHRDIDADVSQHLEPCLDDLPVLGIEAMDRGLSAMAERASALSRRMLAGESVTSFRQRKDSRRVEASERAIARRVDALVRAGSFEEIATRLQPMARAASVQRQIVSIAGRVQSRVLAQAGALEPGVATRISELQAAVAHLIDSSRPGRLDLNPEAALAQQRAIEAFSRGLENHMFVQVRAGNLYDVDAAAVLSRIGCIDELARMVMRTARELAPTTRPVAVPETQEVAAEQQAPEAAGAPVSVHGQPSAPLAPIAIAQAAPPVALPEPPAPLPRAAAPAPAPLFARPANTNPQQPQ